MKAQLLQQGWKEVELGDILDYEQPTKYIVDNTDYKEEYPTPVLTAGKSFVLGHTNEINGIFENLPVIIFDDFTTDSKYVDFKFKVKSSAMKILKPKNKDINLKYVFWAIQRLRFDAKRHKRYYLSAFQHLKILLPPLQIQKQIVAILEKAEELKRKRKDADNLTEEYLKSVFYDMFGDLIINSKKWVIKKLGEICYFENGDRGKNYPSDYSKENIGVPFINAGNLTNGRISEEELNYITSEQYEKLSGGKFKKGDFVFCLRGSLGKYGYNKDLEKGAIASSLVIIRPEKEILPEYLEYYLSSPLCLSLVKRHDSSSSQPNLSANSVKSFEIPLPPLELQNKFASIVKEVEALKEKQKQSKEEINQMFDSLMKQAFNGELIK